MKLGLNFVVRNEEALVEECLKPILPYFDKVTVVDTGSTDRTVEIVEARLGLEVLRYEPDPLDPFNLAPARNFGLDQNSAPWVLTLDADERISPKELEKLVEMNPPDQVLGIFMPWMDCRYGTPFEDYKLFVLRNEHGVRFKGRAHPVPQNHIREMGGDAIWVDFAKVWHHPQSGREHRAYYNDLLLSGIEEDPTWYRYHWFLGYSLYKRGNRREALAILEQACEAESLLFPVETLNSFMVAAQIWAADGGARKALELLERMRHFYQKVCGDFEVKINHRLQNWIEAALACLRSGKPVKAYEFAF